MRLLILLIQLSILLSQQGSNFTTSPKKVGDPKEWIKNNLTAVHSLENHINRKSIVQLMLEDKIPGISIAFVDQTKIGWTASFGVKDLSTSEKVTPKTVFTGASLSKPLAAIAALRAVESGKLELDQDVNSVLRSWKVPENEFTEKEKVTLRRLIGHRAGIRNDLWSSYLPNEDIPTLTQMLAGQPPSIDPSTAVEFAPGSSQKYSNPGYSIIQQILEDVYQESFEDILQTLVFKPSKMKESSFQQPMPEKLKKRRAIGYDENLVAYPYRLFPYKAAGGVWTTPSDMAKFVITLFKAYDGKNNLLSKSTLSEVFSRKRERLGFSKIFSDESKDLIFRHYGSNQGFTAYLVGSLHKRQAVIIMINSDNGFNLLDYIARAVAEYYNWDHLKPVIHKKYTKKIASMGEYEGKFELEHSPKALSFHLKNDLLYIAEENDKEPIALTPIGNSSFISVKNGNKYQFYQPRNNPNGKIEWVQVVLPNGQQNWHKKVN